MGGQNGRETNIHDSITSTTPFTGDVLLVLGSLFHYKDSSSRFVGVHYSAGHDVGGLRATSRSNATMMKQLEVPSSDSTATPLIE